MERLRANRTIPRLGVLLIAGICVAAAWLAGSSPAAAAVDFSGKTIVVTVPFPVAGGQDLWTRFNTPFLTKYLPGKPAIVVKNSPGGGSIAGTNFYAATVKSGDGLNILSVSASTQFPYLLGDERVKYNYADWTPFLVGPTGGAAYISAKLGVKSVAEIGKLKGQPLHFPSQGASSLDLVPLLGFRMLGLDVRHVFGIQGRSEARMGFERGEFNIDHQTTSAYIRSIVGLINKGEAVPLFSWGATDESGQLVRDPNFADLPHIGEAYEIVHGKKPSGLEWDAFRAFLLAGFGAQKLMVLPKNTPAEIVEAYRAAVRQTLKDPEYLAKRDAIIGEYEQVTDEAAEKLYTAATTISPEARAWVRDFLSKNYSTEFK